MSDTTGGSMSRRAFLGATTGSAALAATGTASGAESGSDGSASGGGGTETVTVGPGDDLVFEPAELTVTPGTTVKFVWDGTIAHNVNPTSVPDGASWEGFQDVVTAPQEYSHTFETAGTYEYQCDPHAGTGMVGSIEVSTGGGGGGGSSSGPVLSDSAKTLGVATTGALVSVLGLAYFFIKYGGDYEELE